MCNSSQVPDSQMLSEEQSENFEIFENDQRECNHYPLVFSIDTCSSVGEDKDPLSLERYFRKREERSKSGKNPNLNTSFENRILLSNSESDECSENPILKIGRDIRLKLNQNPNPNENLENQLQFSDSQADDLLRSKINPLLKTVKDIQLKSQGNLILREVFKNSLGINYFKPP